MRHKRDAAPAPLPFGAFVLVTALVGLAACGGETGASEPPDEPGNGVVVTPEKTRLQVVNAMPGAGSVALMEGSTTRIKDLGFTMGTEYVPVSETTKLSLTEHVDGRFTSELPSLVAGDHTVVLYGQPESPKLLTILDAPTIAVAGSPPVGLLRVINVASLPGGADGFGVAVELESNSTLVPLGAPTVGQRTAWVEVDHVEGLLLHVSGSGFSEAWELPPIAAGQRATLLFSGAPETGWFGLIQFDDGRTLQTGPPSHWAQAAILNLTDHSLDVVMEGEGDPAFFGVPAGSSLDYGQIRPGTKGLLLRDADSGEVVGQVPTLQAPVGSHKVWVVTPGAESAKDGVLTVLTVDRYRTNDIEERASLHLVHVAPDWGPVTVWAERYVSYTSTKLVDRQPLWSNALPMTVNDRVFELQKGNYRLAVDTDGDGAANYTYPVGYLPEYQHTVYLSQDAQGRLRLTTSIYDVHWQYPRESQALLRVANLVDPGSDDYLVDGGSAGWFVMAGDHEVTVQDRFEQPLVSWSGTLQAERSYTLVAIPDGEGVSTVLLDDTLDGDLAPRRLVNTLSDTDLPVAWNGLTGLVATQTVAAGQHGAPIGHGFYVKPGEQGEDEVITEAQVTWGDEVRTFPLKYGGDSAINNLFIVPNAASAVGISALLQRANGSLVAIDAVESRASIGLVVIGLEPGAPMPKLHHSGKTLTPNPAFTPPQEPSVPIAQRGEEIDAGPQTTTLVLPQADGSELTWELLLDLLGATVTTVVLCATPQGFEVTLLTALSEPPTSEVVVFNGAASASRAAVSLTFEDGADVTLASGLALGGASEPVSLENGHNVAGMTVDWDTDDPASTADWSSDILPTGGSRNYVFLVEDSSGQIVAAVTNGSFIAVSGEAL